MFTSEHFRELQPPEWMDRPLGSGSYGVVYKATWRGKEVAVKVLKLPERTVNATAAANAKLQQKVEEILSDFVTEVEICADLNHPNLVRLLGYADKPRLMIMQELCEGSSLDQQLYVEDWQPTHQQILKVAHDVALGMQYLHTSYYAEDNVHTQPIIHRDLKSPNLLLLAPPKDGEDVMVKVTDFGLSRDKGLDSENYSQTVMMTGCGSVLWMAPEILLGDTYNEKVDVFSYAMCLLELVNGHLPWSGVATGAEVPHKVTRGQRPTKQLEPTDARPVDVMLAELIKDCWVQRAEQRPDFTTIIQRLEDMMRSAGGGGGGGGARRQSGSSNPLVSPRAARQSGGGGGGLGRGALPSLPEAHDAEDDNTASQPLLAADAVSRPSSRAASPALPDRPPEQEQFGGRE